VDDGAQKLSAEELTLGMTKLPITAKVPVPMARSVPDQTPDLNPAFATFANCFRRSHREMTTAVTTRAPLPSRWGAAAVATTLER
jgi:hypothetical protein